MVVHLKLDISVIDDRPLRNVHTRKPQPRDHFAHVQAAVGQFYFPGRRSFLGVVRTYGNASFKDIAQVDREVGRRKAAVRTGGPHGNRVAGRHLAV